MDFYFRTIFFFQLQKPFHKDDKGTVIFTKYFKAGSVSALKKQLDPHWKKTSWIQNAVRIHSPVFLKQKCLRGFNSFVS